MEAGAESRRSARIHGRFWLAVEGVDAELALRSGDISATGIFFETDGEVGDVGTVQWLHIASLDRTRLLHVMAYVVRVATLADVHREIRGVALEFMPESDEAAASLCEFVRYVLENRNPPESPPSEGPKLSPRVSARAKAAQQAEGPVDVKQLSVRTLLLETDWTVPVGEPVRVEIIARGVRRPIRVEGQAVSVLPALARDGKRFRIAVAVKEELPGPLRRFSSTELRAVDPTKPVSTSSASSALEQLLSALIRPKAEPPERKHLAGQLARIPFTTLCSLLELERLSGVLTVRRESGTVALHVREGRFVDVEPSSDPRSAIAALFECRDGSFELDVSPVSREDRVRASMTELLLELARLADEQRRDA